MESFFWNVAELGSCIRSQDLKAQNNAMELNFYRKAEKHLRRRLI